MLQNLKNSLDIVGKEFIKELAIELVKRDKVASGRLLNSLDYFVLETVDGYLIEIVGENYLTYVDSGRSPGKFPPIQDIMNWINDKGITPNTPMSDEQLAFLIGRKIAEDGIAPTNILQDVYDRIYNNIDSIINNGLDLDIDIILNR